MSNGMPPNGSFSWNELMTRDVAAANKFYTELIGWKAEDAGMPGMDYTVFKVGDRQVAGMMAIPSETPDNVPSHWMAYITVDDVDAAVEKTKQLGGQILHGP